MIRRCALAFSVLSLFLLAGQATAQVELRFKYSPGTNYTTETIGNIKQTLSIAGMDVETSVENIVTTKASIEKPNDSGQTPIKSKVESMQLNIKTTGVEYVFDSANPDDAGASPLEAVRPIHKAIIGSETTLLVGASGRVEEVEAPDVGLDKLPDNVQQLARSQLDPEYLKQQANQALDAIPSMAVKKGDTWDCNESVDLGGSQVMDFKKRYTYQGEVDEGGVKVHRITMKTLEVDFSIGDGLPIPLKLKSSDLKIKESSGEVLFDPMVGNIVRTQQSVNIVGDLAFELNGMELPSKLDLTMKSEVTNR